VVSGVIKRIHWMGSFDKVLTWFFLFTGGCGGSGDYGGSGGCAAAAAAAAASGSCGRGCGCCGGGGLHFDQTYRTWLLLHRPCF